MFAVVPPAIQGLGVSGGFQMQLLLQDAGRLRQDGQMTSRSSQRQHPGRADRTDDVVPRQCPAAVLRRRSGARREPGRAGGRSLLHHPVVSRLDLCQPVQQVRPNLPGVRPGGLRFSAGGRQPAQPLRPQPRGADGAARHHDRHRVLPPGRRCSASTTCSPPPRSPARRLRASARARRCDHGGDGRGPCLPAWAMRGPACPSRRSTSAARRPHLRPLRVVVFLSSPPSTRAGPTRSR